MQYFASFLLSRKLKLVVPKLPYLGRIGLSPWLTEELADELRSGVAAAINGLRQEHRISMPETCTEKNCGPIREDYAVEQVDFLGKAYGFDDVDGFASIAEKYGVPIVKSRATRQSGLSVEHTELPSQPAQSAPPADAQPPVDEPSCSAEPSFTRAAAEAATEAHARTAQPDVHHTSLTHNHHSNGCT